MRKRIAILLLAPVAALLAWFGYNYGYTRNFHTIVPGAAYRSGQMNPEQLTRAIQANGIQSVLNLRGANTNDAWHRAEVATTTALKVTHLDRSLGARKELTIPEMDELVGLLKSAPKPLLIHCEGGADRSGLVSALYRLAIEGEPPQKADNELTIWYGHSTLFLKGVDAMDRSFWNYASNRMVSPK